MFDKVLENFSMETNGNNNDELMKISDMKITTETGKREDYLGEWRIKFQWRFLMTLNVISV